MDNKENFENLKMHTPDFTKENITKLAVLFPNCVTESKDEKGNLKKAIDFDLLKQELSPTVVEGQQERYQLNWPGKREALLLANAPIAKTLRPCREESVDFDNTKNLYIEGDNLDALKLLQETLLGKVKMIYIDPPYNTGNDFVYEDDYTEDSEAYFMRSNQKDELGNRLVANNESNGRFHSDWLSMMYPRLKLARNLLKNDGVIFISIDDGEVANLRKICDEVFGGGNFLANIVWQKKYGPANDAKGISQTHDHLLVYSKSVENWVPGLLPRSDEQLIAFKNPDSDSRGVWRASDLSVKTYNKNCDYEIIGPNGAKFKPPPSRSWVINQAKYEELLNDNRITFGSSGEGRPMQKKFLVEVKDGITPETWWDREKAGDNKIARYELKELFPENVFDTPKPTKLIQYCIKIANLQAEEIVLDFFSGSGSTAHSVIQQNFEVDYKLKFILIQLPEACDEKSEAVKSGYKKITEIGKERIRRAGKKIKDEINSINKKNSQNEMLSFGDGGKDISQKKLDIGFRVLKIDTSNMNKIYYTADKVTQNDLFGQIDNVKDDRTDEDLLFQVLLDWGVDLTLSIQQETIHGKTVFFVGDNALVACFEKSKNVKEYANFYKEVASRKPLRFVLRDTSFSDDSEKINVEQIFKLLSPNTEIKSI